MMENLSFALVALFILAFGAISGKIARAIVTAPMLFVAFGIVMGGLGLDLVNIDIETPFVHGLAELTLVMVLFTDAAHIDLEKLRRDYAIPLRLLAIGLPLCIVLGSVAAMPIFPSLGIWEAVVLAIILAPTDAALGQVVIRSPMVPDRIRRTIEVESGLNDGIALPFLIFFVCLAIGIEHDSGNWLFYAGKQLLFGPLIGISVGWVGARFLKWGIRTESISVPFRDLSALGLAVFAFAAAELIGGNGFIAAFCGGLTLGNTNRDVRDCLSEFAEAEGTLLTLLTFLVFGADMLPEAIHAFSLDMVIYGAISLTLVRMLPAWLVTSGLGLNARSKLFLGWFGPRGVASIIYALIILEESGNLDRDQLFHITMITVLMSVVLHGVTAWPGVEWLNGGESRGEVT